MKGLATRTIGLMMLMVIIVVILIYLFYKSSKPIGVQECSARWFDWCMRCQSGGWNSNMKTPDCVSNCSQTLQKYHNLPNIGVFLTDDTDCSTGGTENDCNALMEID